MYNFCIIIPTDCTVRKSNIQNVKTCSLIYTLSQHESLKSNGKLVFMWDPLLVTLSIVGLIL